MIIMLAWACAGRAAATAPVTATAPTPVMAVAFHPGGTVSDQLCALRAMIIMLTWACADLSTERDTPVLRVQGSFLASPAVAALQAINGENKGRPPPEDFNQQSRMSSLLYGRAFRRMRCASLTA
jgi:hypothetical protein